MPLAVIPRAHWLHRMLRMDMQRIDARQARAHVINGDALLVCAYDTQEKFLKNHLGGALSLQDLEALEDQLPRNREIIFYCA